MKKVYVVSAKRTPIGKFLGSLADMHPAEYGSEVVKAMLDETQVPKDAFDEVIVGNILPAGLGMNIARQVSLGAGIPVEVPAYAVNMVCGSGMKSVINAYTNIKAGMSDLVLAGGVESMSGAPFLIPGKARKGMKMGEFNAKDHMLYDALTDVFNNYHMGMTAENIVEKYGITREAQDAFSAESQRRAKAAQENGKFDDEIVPITVKHRKGEFVFDKDEHLNPSSNEEILAKLRPAFKKDGSVTAGSSSGINDGASFMIIASEEAVEKYGLTPLLEIESVGQGGVAPEVMGLGPVPAIDQAMKRSSIEFKDIGLIELNEAFAAQSLGVFKDLEKAYHVKTDDLLEYTNVNGGAIALGHPVGASGNRITVTLAHEMLRRKETYGLASLCIGGGMGTAVILKKL
ncbi:MAG: acetyl-CoA C-acetyltransferase [Candidatus Izemoplasmataceae bacterium]